MFKIVFLLFINVWLVRCDYELSEGINIEIYNGIDGTKCITHTRNNFEENQNIFVSYNKSKYLYFRPESCYKENNDTHKFVIPVTSLYTSQSYKNVIVKCDMDTIWICPFRNDYYYTKETVLCRIPVHVRCARSADILVNDNALDMSVPKNSVTEYDTESRYEYHDDELVYITCKLLSGTAMKFEVIGFNNESLILPTGYVYTNTLQLRAVLNENHNLSYVDCIVLKTLYGIAIHRIFMVPKRIASTHNDSVIRVNGLIPAMASTSNGYFYRYEKGELVNVTCENFNSLSRVLNLAIEDYEYGPVKEVGHKAVTVIIDTSKIGKNNKLLITCNQVGNINKDILLKEEVPTNDVVILGLSQRNVIFKYVNEISSNIIIYKYKDYEVLNLTWMYGGRDVNSHYRMNILLTWKDKVLANPENVLATPMINITSQTIRLSPHDNGSIIKCIVIIYKPTIYQENNVHTEQIHEIWIYLRRIVDTTSEISTGNKDTTNNALQMSKLLVPVSCGICFLIVIVSLGVLYAYCKRRRTSPKQTDESNDTNDITQCIKSAEQFPESWDNYANAMINTQPSTSSVDHKHMYATPIPKKYRLAKDQTVVRENSLYEPLENDSKDFNKNVNKQRDIFKGQNYKRYGNIADYSTGNYKTQNQEMELYSEVSLTG